MKIKDLQKLKKILHRKYNKANKAMEGHSNNKMSYMYEMGKAVAYANAINYITELERRVK